jgi:streptogramin lyase
MRRLVLLLTILATGLVAVPSAQAYIVQERAGLAATTQGIAIGPDTNVWVAESGSGTVARLTPGGDVLQRWVVGASPTNVVTVGDKVFVAVTGATNIAWFDAKSVAPTLHVIDTGGTSSCGPKGIAAGAGKLYVSYPGCSQMSTIDNSGTGTVNGVLDGFDEFDTLAFRGGKVFGVAAVNGNMVRFDPDLNYEANWSTPGGSSPQGLTFDAAGRAWCADKTTGKLFRFDPNDNSGNIDQLTPLGGPLAQPTDVTASPDGGIYVTGNNSSNLVRLDPNTGQFRFFPVGGGGAPLRIVNGPDGDLFFTDSLLPRILRFVNGPPRTTTGVASASAATVVAATGLVDPRGNDTLVVFEYGPTTAYGTRSAAVTLPAGAGAVPVTSVLSNLTPQTTYHVRALAANGEGTVVGGDTTVTTPQGLVDNDKDGASPPADCDDNDPKRFPGNPDVPQDGIDQDCNGKDAPYPRLAASVRWSYANDTPVTFIIVREAAIKGLAGGERAVITCSSKKLGCAFRKKTYKKLKQGRKRFQKLFKGRHLKVGAKLTVRITRKGHIGYYNQLKVRKGKLRPATERCLRPGSSKPRKRC